MEGLFASAVRMSLWLFVCRFGRRVSRAFSQSKTPRSMKRAISSVTHIMSPMRRESSVCGLPSIAQTTPRGIAWPSSNLSSLDGSDIDITVCVNLLHNHMKWILYFCQCESFLNSSRNFINILLYYKMFVRNITFIAQLNLLIIVWFCCIYFNRLMTIVTLRLLTRWALEHPHFRNAGKLLRLAVYVFVWLNGVSYLWYRSAVEHYCICVLYTEWAGNHWIVWNGLRDKHYTAFVSHVHC